MGTPARIKLTIDYPKYGSTVSYSATYLADGSQFDASEGSGNPGVHTMSIDISDVHPKTIRKPYLIPHYKAQA